MKKMLSFLLLFTVIISSVSMLAFAIIPGEDAVQSNEDVTFGQIAHTFEQYLMEQQLDIPLGSQEYYRYAWEQVYGNPDDALTAHPMYIQIDAYLTRYILMYQEYLYCKDALQQDVDMGEALIEQFSDDNRCLFYNNNTKELRFVLSNAFLEQSLAERRAENQLKRQTTELLVSQAASTCAVSSYSSSDAIAYAKQYANSANIYYPDYRTVITDDFGNPIKTLDCTNFVSQCIYAGGVSMDGSNSSQGTYQSTTDWYCRYVGGSFGIRLYALTTSWISADDFSDYMTLRANKKYVVDTIDEVYAKCRPGDVVQWVKKVDADVHHSVIISSKDSSTAYFCAHSNPHDGTSNDSIHAHFDEEKDYFIIFSFLPNQSSGIGSIDECGQCADIPQDYYTEFHSASLDRVIVCPTHETHDAEVYQYRYDAYCSIHDNYVGSIYETAYICLDE